MWTAMPSRSFRDHASRYDAQSDSIDFDMMLAPGLKTADPATDAPPTALPASNRKDRRLRKMFMRILVCDVGEGNIDDTDSQVWTKMILSSPPPVTDYRRPALFRRKRCHARRRPRN